jgi:hypothetical protein
MTKVSVITISGCHCIPLFMYYVKSLSIYLSLCCVSPIQLVFSNLNFLFPFPFCLSVYLSICLFVCLSVCLHHTFLRAKEIQSSRLIFYELRDNRNISLSFFLFLSFSLSLSVSLSLSHTHTHTHTYTFSSYIYFTPEKFNELKDNRNMSRVLFTPLFFLVYSSACEKLSFLPSFQF